MSSHSSSATFDHHSHGGLELALYAGLEEEVLGAHVQGHQEH